MHREWCAEPNAVHWPGFISAKNARVITHLTEADKQPWLAARLTLPSHCLAPLHNYTASLAPRVPMQFYC